MAYIKVEFLSESLRRIVPFIAVIPNDPDYNGTRRDYEKIRESYKTLYLLHGYTGGANDWINGTNIEQLTRKYNFAVIMPAGENAFYVDCPHRDTYFGEYIGEELVQYTREIFPLSRQREDTFIGGLSMGGYGAMRNGLKYHKNFSKIMSFSGAYVELDIADDGFYDEAVTSKKYQQDVFGAHEELARSDKDPRYLYQKIKEEGGKLPSIYMTCGTEDTLLRLNRKLVSFFRDENANIRYIESKGGHDWAFWNKYLEDSVQWMIEN